MGVGVLPTVEQERFISLVQRQLMATISAGHGRLVVNVLHHFITKTILPSPFSNSGVTRDSILVSPRRNIGPF